MRRFFIDNYDGLKPYSSLKDHRRLKLSELICPSSSRSLKDDLGVNTRAIDGSYSFMPTSIQKTFPTRYASTQYEPISPQCLHDMSVYYSQCKCRHDSLNGDIPNYDNIATNDYDSIAPSNYDKIANTQSTVDAQIHNNSRCVVRPVQWKPKSGTSGTHNENPRSMGNKGYPNRNQRRDNNSITQHASPHYASVTECRRSTNHTLGG